MGRCNLKMSDDCYGCGYYAYGDTEGCLLTIKFHFKYPYHSDEEYEQYMKLNSRHE